MSDVAAWSLATGDRRSASMRNAQSRSMTNVIAEPGRLARTGPDIAVYQRGRPQGRITSSARSTGSKPGGQIERSDRCATPDVSPTDRAEIPPLNNAVFSVEPEVGPVITEALRERGDGERVWNELDAYGCGRLMWRLASDASTAWQRPSRGRQTIGY